MKLVITKTKKDWTSPTYSITLDGKTYDEYPWNLPLSNTLTCALAQGRGIFSLRPEVLFTRDNTTISVDFGNGFDPNCTDLLGEIKRRVELVASAFEAVRENYTVTWETDI